VNNPATETAPAQVSARLEQKDDHAPARLERQTGIHVEAIHLGAPEGRLELDAANNGIPLKHEIVAAVIDLWLEDIEPLDSGQSHMPHHLTGE
jgi:hypothetical protein